MEAEQIERFENAKRAVITVGEGRGFVVETRTGHYVITAAHCLPHFPPAASVSYYQERTYAGLLGPLGESKPKVWAECMFVDPVADIAVLSNPDNQDPSDHCEIFESFMESISALQIGEFSEDGTPAQSGRPESFERFMVECRAWILTLNERWVECVAGCWSDASSFWIKDAAEPIIGGMSGSPVLDMEARAIGVMVCSAGGADTEQHTEGFPLPRLTESLPRWLLRKITEPPGELLPWPGPGGLSV